MAEENNKKEEEINNQIEKAKKLIQPMVEYVQKRVQSIPENELYKYSAVLGVISVLLFASTIASFVCNLVGFVYPAFKSAQAIESLQLLIWY